MNKHFQHTVYLQKAVTKVKSTPFRTAIKMISSGGLLLACQSIYAANALAPYSSLGGTGLETAIANPAQLSANQKLGYSSKVGVGFNGGVALEYGNVDEIFKIIDTISYYLSDKDDGSSPPEPPPEALPPQPGNLPYQPTIEDIINNNPEYVEWFDALQKQATFLASALAIISQESYAKGYADFDGQLLISHNIYGGSLAFGLKRSGLTKARGILDDFDWNTEEALQVLQDVIELEVDAPREEFHLSDDILLVVDRSNNDLDVKMDNDSLLLTRSSVIQQFHLDYSRQVLDYTSGSLQLGLRPKIIHAGLSQVDTRFGDITDSSELVDDIKNADLHYSTKASLDIGAYWNSNNYSLGFSVSDLFSPSFAYPAIDRSRYSKSQVLQKIHKTDQWKLSRQSNIEANIYTTNRRWMLSANTDLETTSDPMGDLHKWRSIGVQYMHPSRKVPSARLGYRTDIARKDLEYISIGTTIAKLVQIDLASTLNTVSIDGKTLPRGMALNLGFQFNF